MSTVLSLHAWLQVVDPQQPANFGPWLLATLVKLLVFFTVYLVGVAYTTLAERKISAWIQGRHGPNRVGPRGLFQPLADGVKNFMKEETLPPHVNRAIFILAPMLSFIPALMVWAIIPWGASWASPWGRIDMVLADLPIGFLFTLAIGSLGVYGIVLAGWGSNNKYALLGGLRSSAQMISYEISMGMSLIPVLLLVGNVTLRSVVNQQADMHLWNVLTLAVAFVCYLISAFAETNRLPFDMPEAESELVSGFNTEFSGMRFGLYALAEFMDVIMFCCVAVAMFLGGWNLPFVDFANIQTGWKIFGGNADVLIQTLFMIGVFLSKVAVLIFIVMWIRWTLPRLRVDQLMSLCWKYLIPIGLFNLLGAAIWMMVFHGRGIVELLGLAGGAH